MKLASCTHSYVYVSALCDTYAHISMVMQCPCVCVCLLSALSVRGGVGVNCPHLLLSVGGEAHRSIKTAPQRPHKQLPNHHAYRTQPVCDVPSLHDKSDAHMQNTTSLYKVLIRTNCNSLLHTNDSGLLLIYGN